MNNTKLVLAITGIRSEYDIMSSVYKSIQKHPKLNLKLVVTGAHLSKDYGYTIEDIKKDGFDIAETVPSLLSGDSNSFRVKGLAIQLQSIIHTVERLKPDFLLVLGDREEAMTTALIGAYMNIAVIHLAGGDRVIGNVDDQVRHAVTKLSHLHLTTNAESFERIINLGEESFRVFNVGNPGLDRFLNTPHVSIEDLNKSLKIDIKKDEVFLIVLQHVISSEVEQANFQIQETLEAIKDLRYKTILIYPNSDAGSREIINVIRKYEKLKFLYTFKNIPRIEYINLLRNASCLIGNSSAGILEAPLIKLPVINIGNRQKGRLHAENVNFVSHNREEIKKAIDLALFNTEYKNKVLNCSNPYGDGQSSLRIANIIADTIIDQRLLIKDITY
jgi:GDP/UDP-N,N'-diacetylbacillosamine 2-epimerase (hydrolysing)